MRRHVPCNEHASVYTAQILHPLAQVACVPCRPSSILSNQTANAMRKQSWTSTELVKPLRVVCGLSSKPVCCVFNSISSTDLFELILNRQSVKVESTLA